MLCVIPQHQLRGMRVQMDLPVNQRDRRVEVRGVHEPRSRLCREEPHQRRGSRGTAPCSGPAGPVRSGADLQGDRDAPDAGPGKARSGAEYLLAIVSGRMRSP